MKYLLEIATVFLAVAVCACSEKKEGIKAEKVAPSQSDSSTELESSSAKLASKPIVIINDAIKQPVENKLRVTASVYDVAALPLGENFNSMEQLQSASKIAVLTSITHSGQLAKIDEQGCVFATETILGEDLKLVDLAVKISVKDMLMKFSTTLRRGSSGFYELSQEADSNRMYVVVLSADFEKSDAK